jgi:hypothetical protein
MPKASSKYRSTSRTSSRHEETPSGPSRQNRLYGSACSDVGEWLGLNGGSDTVRVLLTSCFGRLGCNHASFSLTGIFPFPWVPRLYMKVKRDLDLINLRVGNRRRYILAISGLV